MLVVTHMQLIRDIGITNGDETQVGYYVGLMVSLTQSMGIRLF